MGFFRFFQGPLSHCTRASNGVVCIVLGAPVFRRPMAWLLFRMDDGNGSQVKKPELGGWCIPVHIEPAGLGKINRLDHLGTGPWFSYFSLKDDIIHMHRGVQHEGGVIVMADAWLQVSHVLSLNHDDSWIGRVQI
mmetsp:Transcript_8112/g.16333  ORF Transcript_8112/g.16333 Transcript_8112/m.16333 type:complete len:135 (+) Transcript_8112:88-492(+)